MNSHDWVREIEKHKTELISKISPKFNELSLDIQQIAEYSKDPVFMAALLFKLAEERQRTNEIIEKLNEKYDRIMFELKSSPRAHIGEMQAAELGDRESVFKILPEQDQIIVSLAEKRENVDAEAVRALLGYKGKNAASQRLNKLFREGHLRKVHSGKKVLYLAKR